MLSTKEYEHIAGRVLGKINPLLAANEKYISILVTKLVQADAQYDPNHKSGTKLETYRYKALQFGVRQILKMVKDNAKFESYDQLYNVSGSEIEPIDILIKEEEEEGLNNRIDSILSHPKLSEMQRNCLREYYINGKKLKQIAFSYGVTKQAISQQIQSGLNKLRESL